MAALASDWLRHFRLLLWNRWTEFNETWQEARSQLLLPCLCFLGRSEKQDGGLGLWLARDIFDFFSETAERNSMKLDRKQDFNVLSTKFVFFGPIGKTRWPPWLLIGWDIFDFSSETAEQNSTKLDKKQDLNVLYQAYVFFGRSEKQDGHPGLWLAETFSTSRLKPLNGIQRSLTGSEILRSSTKFVFLKRSEKQDGRPGLWLAEIFLTSPLKLLNRIQRNLTGSKILMSSTKFVFLWADRKIKMAALASDWLRHFRLLLWNRWMEFNETWQEART